MEVGAGFGGTTKFLCNGEFDRWICLEPDAGLAERLAVTIRTGTLPPCCQVEVGTLDGREGWRPFDAILPLMRRLLRFSPHLPPTSRESAESAPDAAASAAPRPTHWDDPDPCSMAVATTSLSPRTSPVETATTPAGSSLPTAPGRSAGSARPSRPGTPPCPVAASGRGTRPVFAGLKS